MVTPLRVTLHPVSSLKVERGGIDGSDPLGKTSTHLIYVVHF